ncbi:ABC transporter ATP-binding protein [Aeromonas veronii]
MGKVILSKVGKSYKIYNSRFDRLKDWVLPGDKKRFKQVSVLKDISFSLRSGESVGIIGVNGAGKSTLLKIITGTLPQSTGTVNLEGRLVALLELGMGFHPDYTGRENVYMAGQLTGLSKEDIDKKFKEIEEFAEIGSSIDQPVKTYSSGMQVRLAFSVATCVRPSILIVDEALSVGDAYFQAKSFDRIKEFKRMGTTLILVSHDQQAILNVCDRALLLEEGEIKVDANPQEVINIYNAKLSKTSEQHSILVEGEKVTSGSMEAVIESVGIFNSDFIKRKTIYVGEVFVLRFCIKSIERLKDITLGFQIKDRLGNVIYGTNTLSHEIKIDMEPNCQCHIDFELEANIGIGEYTLTAALHDKNDHYDKSYHWVDGIAQFSIVSNKEHFVGSAWLKTKCSTSKVN